ncbi:MAG: hypothetical protein M1838_003571 [Thelocarpon superellum]|nr:MAG: hypothetical protein M1838_003571 [Thelocarpon superellum]
MDFLKSAVASAISKGPPFPYTFGERVDHDECSWALYNGTKREDGSNCSIFSFDVTANKSSLPLARNAVRKLRTLRHPGVVKVLDTVETETYIYMATERVTPLAWHVRRQSLSTETTKWGLYNIARTIKFINDEASSVHGNLRTSSIFTSESGEWRLGGFDVLSSMKDDEAVIYNYGSLLRDSGRYAPPEVARSGWDTIKRNPISAVDSYNLGTLIYEVFNGGSMGLDQAGQTKNVPPSMHQSYKRLVNSNPKTRLSVAHFLEQGRRSGGFFETPLIRVTEGVDNLGLKNESEREEFLSELGELSDDFPEEFFKMKVLPELLKSMEFGGGGPKVFGVIMRIGTKLSDDEYDARITPVIVRLFASPDRAIRVCLLDHLPLMIDHLPEKVVNSKIFPQLVTGFTDVAPVVREQTVKSVLTVINKLSERTINGELLKYLAKTSNDEQPGIRTNTTICLGKIARNLGPHTREKVLTAAFVRSLRDPFVHARMAALMALHATADVFTPEDCANRILPGMCPSLIDKEKMVREQANKTLDAYLQRVRKHGTTLPDSILPPPGSEATGGAVPRMGTPQSDTSWAGWAISSFTNKLASASGEMQPTSGTNGTNARIKVERSTSAPPSADATRTFSFNSSSTATASTLARQATSSAALPTRQTSAPNYLDNGANYEADDGEDDEDGGDAWAEMEDDDFFDASSTPKDSATTKSNTSAATNGSTPTPIVAYDDGGEPDFAGWLTAQAQAKSKNVLPKGLAKKKADPGSNGARSTSTTTNSTSASTLSAGKANAKGATKAATTSPASSKPIDTRPKDDGDDDDGWGDGW